MMTEEIQTAFERACAGREYVIPLPAVSMALDGVAECSTDEGGQISLLEWAEWERGSNLSPATSMGRLCRRLRSEWNGAVAKALRAKIEERD